MDQLTEQEHQRSLEILEAEIQLAAKQAVLRYKDTTGLTPESIRIRIEDRGDDPDIEVSTRPAPL